MVVQGRAVRAAFAALAVLCCASSASAQSSGTTAIDVEAVTQCLFERTTEDQIASMKKLVIAALEENIPVMQEHLIGFGTSIVSLAMTACGVGLSQLNDPTFAEVSEKYGALLGDKVIGDAFAKLK